MTWWEIALAVAAGVAIAATLLVLIAWGDRHDERKWRERQP